VCVCVYQAPTDPYRPIQTHRDLWAGGSGGEGTYVYMCMYTGPICIYMCTFVYIYVYKTVHMFVS